MNISVSKPQSVDAKELRIYMKVCDTFCASLHAADGIEICGQEDGYVPGFMPGQHYGDYLILNIDIETGQITNWQKPGPRELAEWVASLTEDSE
jgi:hypothetical protein